MAVPVATDNPMANAGRAIAAAGTCSASRRLQVAGWAVAMVLTCTRVTPAAGEAFSYNRDIRPILSSNCFHCHGSDEAHREAELRLDLRDDAIRHPGGYAAIVPGDADASEIVRRIDSDDESERMPPVDSGKHLTPEQRAIVRQWINQGAPYERHWSFVRPVRPAVPDVGQENGLSPIDRFVWATLDNHGLKPSPRADKGTLIRRVTLDLTGLPPTPEAVRRFLDDDAPDAYQRLVDRLLTSPACAERLTQEWLDVARYADTNGFSIDDHRDMWAWRDWVIKAMSDNMPYDQFLTEQLAGDLLPNASQSQRIATGFLRNSMNTHEGGTIAEEYRMIYTVDKVDTVATAFMGLTMKCSQCHDHKYDPISQRDYYRFYAYFDRSSEPGKGAENGNTSPVLEVTPPYIPAEQLAKLRRQREATLEQWLSTLPPELRTLQEETEKAIIAELQSLHDIDIESSVLLDAVGVELNQRTDEQSQLVNAAVDARCDAVSDYRRSVAMELEVVRRAIAHGRTTVMVMDNAASDRTTHIRIRGQYSELGEVVEPGVPEFLLTRPAGEDHGRLELAGWLTAPEHPLTARVAVNRYWQMLFGTGIVETAEDFGTQGAYPTHPELLDWLAVDFIEHQWDLRRLLKQMVMSSTYCQSSNADAQLLAADPRNLLLARASRIRLPAESIRDNALAIGGMLNPMVGGPSDYPPQPDGLWREVSHYGHPTLFTAQAYYPSTGSQRVRRSMYTFWKRSSPPPMLTTFDAPTRETCTVRRQQTNTPLQALVLLNDPQFVEAARGFANRIVRNGGDSTDARLNYAFEVAVARPPTPAERNLLGARLNSLVREFSEQPALDAQFVSETANPADQPASAEVRAWTIIASILLNLDEVITRG